MAESRNRPHASATRMVTLTRALTAGACCWQIRYQAECPPTLQLLMDSRYVLNLLKGKVCQPDRQPERKPSAKPTLA